MRTESPFEQCRHLEWTAGAAERIEIESEETAAGCDFNTIRLTISIDQRGRGVRPERRDGFLLIGRHGLQPTSERAENRTEILIHDRREVRVTIPRDQGFESRGAREHDAGGMLADGLRQQRLAGSG